MSNFDSMLIQLDKERFKKTESKWLSSDSSYEIDAIPISIEKPQLDWTVISNQLNRKKIDATTLTDRVSNVSMRMFRKDYK
jgi:hypothetical protein